MPAHDRALALHQRAYQSLLVLYPPGFRRDWGGNTVFLLGALLTLAGTAMGLGQLWRRTRHRERHS